MSTTGNGFLKIYRQFFDHFLWDEEREYSKAEAWIWMIKEARYKPGKSKKLMGGNLIEWGRGELPASLRFLKQAWGWGSTGKVRRYLDLLESENMIRSRTEQGQNVITLCNYDTYNKAENQNETATEHRQDAGETPTKQQQNTNRTQTKQNSKKVKKVKKEKKGENLRAPARARPPDESVDHVKGCPIPEPLQIEGFTERYEDYWQHATDKFKKTPSIQAVQAQFRRLIELKGRGHPPLEVIDQTIREGNNAFYPLKDNQFESNKKTNGTPDIEGISNDIDEILADREASAQTAGTG